MSRPKRSIIWSMPDEEFKRLVKNSTSIGQILQAFNLQNKGGNSNTVKRRIQSQGIDMSHIILGRGSNKGKTYTRLTNEEMFVSNSITRRKDLKRRLIRDKLIPFQCRYCGITDLWNNKPIVLQLEHINGVCNDNRLENLCFLCPNCHSQTDTFSGKNAGRVGVEPTTLGTKIRCYTS